MTNFNEYGVPTVGGVDFRVMGALAILFFTALMVFAVLANDASEAGASEPTTTSTTAPSDDG